MKSKKKIVVLTGAGISAASGIPTFRDAKGLWEGHDIRSVASIMGWEQDPIRVQEFYNMRRKVALAAIPNVAHQALVELERAYELNIITQNVDLLHEKAGSTQVLHLHGRLDQARSTVDENLIYPIDGFEIKMGDLCEKGSQLRPNIVWFGEAVPLMEAAINLVSQADILLIIGTSLVVYPAAGLRDYLPKNSQLYVVDQSLPNMIDLDESIFIQNTAAIGVPQLVKQLLKDAD